MGLEVDFDSVEFKAYRWARETERAIQEYLYNSSLIVQVHDHKGYSEEKCIRCGWVMGHPALNCNNDDTPHVFPSQIGRLM